MRRHSAVQHIAEMLRICFGHFVSGEFENRTTFEGPATLITSTARFRFIFSKDSNRPSLAIAVFRSGIFLAHVMLGLLCV